MARQVASPKSPEGAGRCESFKTRRSINWASSADRSQVSTMRPSSDRGGRPFELADLLPLNSNTSTSIITPQHGRYMIIDGGRNKRLVQVGYMRRYNPAVNAPKQRGGWLGDIFQVCGSSIPPSTRREKETREIQGWSDVEPGGRHRPYCALRAGRSGSLRTCATITVRSMTPGGQHHGSAEWRGAIGTAATLPCTTSCLGARECGPLPYLV
jgi:hypothetical protein